MSSRSCSSQKPLEVGQPRHLVLLLGDDLAQHAGRVAAGQAGEVDGGLGVAGPLQHAALAGLEREDVAGAEQVAGPGARVDERLDGGGAVGGRDAGGGAVAVVDGEEERGALALGVLCDHRGEVELAGPLGGDGAQITPEVWRRKNAIVSGVANSAAMMRSPSFSRSSSSTTTTISPRPMAATASSILAKRHLRSVILPGEEAFDVLGGDVDLEVDAVARALAAERGDRGGVRDDGDGEAVVGRPRRR